MNAIRRYSSAASKRALTFPGQGFHRTRMADQLLKDFPQITSRVLEQANSTLDFNLSNLMRDGPISELSLTQNAQPAILTTSIIILTILQEKFGIDPVKHFAYILGHSLGEFAALTASGCFDFDTALRVTRHRGFAMSKRIEEYGRETVMYAVLVEVGRTEKLIEDVERFLKKDAESRKGNNKEIVEIAHHNSSSQITLTGSPSLIKTAIENLQKFGGHDPRLVPLAITVPFHCSIMAPVAEDLEEYFKDIEFGPFKVPVISNVSARPFTSENVRNLLALQSTKRVLWKESVHYAMDQGAKEWISIGPGKIVRNLVGIEVGRENTLGVETPQEMEELAKRLGV